MDKKTRPTYVLPPKDPSQKETHRLKVKRWEKICHASGKGKQSWGSSTYMQQNRLQNQGYSKRQRRTQHNDKGNNPMKDITLLNIYAPNTGAPKYVKQILVNIKGQINRNTVIVGDFNTPLTSMDRSSRQKINKETVALTH